MINKQWLSFAQEDYLALLSLWEQELALYRVICFHAQQYTEKILKGLLAEKNITPPRIHDIIKLSKLCQRIDIQIPLSKDDQALLSSVYIDTRYPPDAGLLPNGEPSKEDAKIIIEIIKKLKQWVDENK